MTSTMQLEFAQAMSDFKTMFPEMDKDVIEAVLRANQGAVDATIDQLLAMSTDNQNERLRNELDEPDGSSISKEGGGSLNQLSSDELIGINSISDRRADLLLGTTAPSVAASLIGTGASPKIKKSILSGNSSSCSQNSSPARKDSSCINKKWDPPMLGPLPANFLRLSTDGRTDYDIPDEQFALMLQNEEFMNELRWNQEFMLALEKEQHDKGRGEDDAVFKERLKHMGKKSRKKFLQLAKVFTFQRNKKPGAVRHPDSLLLQEDHSDDDEPKRTPKK